MFSLCLNSSIEKRLSSLAKEKGKTKTSCVREAILEYIENAEDILVATHRLKNPGKMYSFGELKRELAF